MLGVRRLPCGFLVAQPCFPHASCSGLGKGFALCPSLPPPWACVKPAMEVPSKVQGQMSDPGVLLGNCLSNEDPCRESLLTKLKGLLLLKHINISTGQVNQAHRLPSHMSQAARRHPNICTWGVHISLDIQGAGSTRLPRRVQGRAAPSDCSHSGFSTLTQD